MKIRCWMFSKPLSAGSGATVADAEPAEAVPAAPVVREVTPEPSPPVQAAATSTSAHASMHERVRFLTARDATRHLQDREVTWLRHAASSMWRPHQEGVRAWPQRATGPS